MRNLLYTITLICLCFNLTIEAQTTINTNVSQKCNSLTIQYSYTTTLPSVTSVKWNFGRNLNDTSTFSNPNPVTYPSGLYTVTLVLNVSDTTEIQVGRPDAFFSYRSSFDYGHFTLIFQAGVGGNTLPVAPPYTYRWSIQGRTLENPDSSFLIHRFDSVGDYRVRLLVTDTLNCTDTIIRRVVIRDTLIVPNVFTPNDDPFNNELRIPTNGKNKFSFKVFSRTGLMVYTTESKILSWDGRLQSGEKALPGIYYYVIETLDLSPPKKQAGFFYIYH